MSHNVLNQYIAKIEGHGQLKYNVAKGSVRIEIEEGERLFEKLVVGQNYIDVPFITARICGVCPTAHTLAAIRACEDAFEIQLNDSIMHLRRALLSAQLVQSHALHLFFFALPDFLDVQNGLELHDKNPRVFEIATTLKGVGDNIIETIGGRSVHPVSPTVGGFLSVPKEKEIEGLIKNIRSNQHLALEALEMFAGFYYPHLDLRTEYLSLSSDDKVDILGDTIISSEETPSPSSSYPFVFQEKVKSYSSAKFSEKNGHGFLVGALARLNQTRPFELNSKAKKAVRSLGIEFPIYNTFKNNLAQAVELLHYLEEAEKSLVIYLEGKNQRHKEGYQIKAGTGVGAIEAPRGTLYHMYEFDKNGVVINCDIVTPTAQNLTNLEDDANEYLRQNKSITIPRRQKELEMLIRAYDPCITCSVH